MERLTPGSGYAELLAGARSAAGGLEAYGRAEAGWRPTENASLFGFGEAAISPGLGPSWQAGVGARVTW